MKERIRKLLASGLKASEVAQIVGCTPAYVSQLCKDPEFMRLVEADLIEAQEKNTEEELLDTRYQTTEHKLISAINEQIPNADLPALTRTLEIIGRRQSERRKEKNPVPITPQIAGVNIHITQLQLPAHAVAAPAPVVSVNENNEIISIDSRPLAPMSADGVKNIFAQLAARNQAVIANGQQVLQEL